MNFIKVCEKIIGGLEREQVRYALIGSFAMGALGISGATVDLDFLVQLEDLPKIDRLMKAEGYQTAYQTENVSQYISPDEIFGEVDFLYAFKKNTLGMLSRALEKDIFGGKMKMKILIPEDLIGLKVQCAANDENRTAMEYVDIEKLMDLYHNRMDWNLVQEYFAIFGEEARFRKAKRKYSNAK